MGSEEQRLANIEAKQAETIALLNALTAKMDDSLKATEAWKERISKTLYGDEDSKGILTKIALLEDALARSRWYVRTMMAALITLVVGGLFSLIS